MRAQSGTSKRRSNIQRAPDAAKWWTYLRGALLPLNQLGAQPILNNALLAIELLFSLRRGGSEGIEARGRTLVCRNGVRDGCEWPACQAHLASLLFEACIHD